MKFISSHRLGRSLIPILACTIAAVLPALADEKAEPAAPTTPAAPATPAPPGTHEVPASPAAAAPAAQSDEDKAWSEIAAQATRPTPPAEWQQNKPSEEAIKAWQKSEGERLLKLADQAHDFAQKYPASQKVASAADKEEQALTYSTQLGNEEAGKRLDTIDAAKLADTKTPENVRFSIRARQVQRAAQAKYDSTKDMNAAFAELESGARALLKEFPSKSEPYRMLLQIANNGPADKARAIAEEIAKSNADEPVKAQAAGLLKKLDAVGKPVDIQFTAIDGRKVNLQEMKGKVVLIDFWATWCGPCVAELPHVKAAYDKLHEKGFEIIGISFDQDKSALEKFVKEKEMAWPQFFDGNGWKNKFGQEFGINSIPAMWLIDKQGLLREQNARQDLEGKIEKLLAE